MRANVFLLFCLLCVGCQNSTLGTTADDAGTALPDAARDASTTIDGEIVPADGAVGIDSGPDAGPAAPGSNRAPRAIGESFTTALATAVTVNGLLANDSDPDGDELTITAHTEPMHGSLVAAGGADFTYTPSAGFVGEDSFTYTISDDKGATHTAVVYLYVARRIFYVSNAGSDSAAGTSPESAWQTLDKVRTQMSSLRAGDAVLLRRGDLFRSLHLAVSVHATAAEPFILGAYGTGARPEIRGSNVLSGWSARGDGSFAAAAATAPSHIYIDSARQTAARFPSTGWLRTDTGSGGTTIVDSELTQAAGTWDGASVRIRTTNWSYSGRRIASYTPGQLTLETAVDRPLTPADDWGYFIDGAEAALDAPGEWAYADGQVIVRPASGVSLDSSLVEVASEARGVDLTGEYIILDDVAVRHYTEMAVRVGYDKEAHAKIRHVYVADSQVGIRSIQVTDVVVQDSTIENTYGTAVRLEGRDTGLGGTIERCFIRNAGLFGYGESFGNGGIATSGNEWLIRENVVENIGYIGILTGGTNTIVERNVVRHTLTQVNDGGGISFDNTDGLIIRNNVVLDSVGELESASHSQSAHLQLRIAMGIYFGNARILNTHIENNFVTGQSTGIHVDHTWESAGNLLRGNVAIGNLENQITFSDFSNYVSNPTGGSDCIPMYDDGFQDNLMVSTDAVQKPLYVLEVHCLENLAWGVGDFDRNRYFTPYSNVVVHIFDFNSEEHAGETHHFELTLAQWAARNGGEVNSSVWSLPDTDPEFVYYYNEDFGTRTVVLGAGTFVDLDGNPVTGPVAIEALGSRIYIRR